jgi:hypothetical protein
MTSGKVSENAKAYIRKSVLECKTYAQVAEEVGELYGIEITKQAVNYYVGKMELRDQINAAREAQKKAQESEWRQGLRAYVESQDVSTVTLREASAQIGAPHDWTRDALMSLGAYDDTTFRSRIDDVELMTRYIIDDLSLSELHESYYNDVCISTLTQTVRQLLKEHNVDPRPKSCANNEPLKASWRLETLEKLKSQGWAVAEV